MAPHLLLLVHRPCRQSFNKPEMQYAHGNRTFNTGVRNGAVARSMVSDLSLLCKIQSSLHGLGMYPGIGPPLDLSNAQFSTMKTVNFDLGDFVTRCHEIGGGDLQWPQLLLSAIYCLDISL